MDTTGKQETNIIERPSIEDVADWFLSKEAMTHKKLQKLCYYAVAWGYALTNRRLFNRDEFQAWVHGPVSPTLYKKYKNYGWNNIEKVKTKPNFPNNIEEILESVWATYGDKDGNELEVLSHSEAPWINARKGLAENERGDKKIDTKVMEEFYKSIYSGEYASA